MAFDFPKVNFNMFQQPVQHTGAVGTWGTPAAGGTERAGATYGITGGGSAVDRDIADMKRFLPAFNGTGELQPNNAESGAKLQMLYA